jgi:CCR4-NOT complex subunit CAF16
VLRSVDLELQRGARMLLVGANGAGKTTLLQILAGKHMVPEASVHILGHPPFHTTWLTTGGHLAYIGGNWERDVAFAGYSVPLGGDFPAAQMLDSIPNVSAARRKRLVQVLDVDEAWRMHTVSDGQRRRVQIACGLLRPATVLLLDEVTVR